VRSALRIAVVLVAVTGFGASAPAEPAPKRLSAQIARLTDYGIRRGDRLVKQMTANDAHKQLALKDGGQLGLGELVGKGYFGAVYHLDRASQERLASDRPMVVKLAHGWRWSARRLLRGWLGKPAVASVGEAVKVANDRLRAEIQSRQFLSETAALAEQSPLYPKGAAWAQGHVPVVPIEHALETERGPVALKPFVRGLSLGQVYKRGGGRLTKEMIASLRELYDYVQAVADAVHIESDSGFAQPKVVPRGQGVGLALDARPTNLIWVEEPATLASLALSRPSFVFVELDQSVGNTGRYLAKRTSFDGYVGEVLTTARDDAR
jgi:hypothetical protein